MAAVVDLPEVSSKLLGTGFLGFGAVLSAALSVQASASAPVSPGPASPRSPAQPATPEEAASSWYLVQLQL